MEKFVDETLLIILRKCFKPHVLIELLHEIFFKYLTILRNEPCYCCLFILALIK